MHLITGLLGQFRKPSGWVGRLVARAMNRGHEL